MTIELPCRGTRLALVLALLLSVAPAFAQQDEPAEEDYGFGDWIVEIGFWVAQPSGLGDYVTSTMDPADPFSTRLLAPSHGTHAEDFSRFGIDLARDQGKVLVSWYAHRDEAELHLRNAGSFIYGEILANPATAGFALDGLADAVDANNQTVLRDLRLTYYRPAFSGSRVEGSWFAGFRRVIFKHRTDVMYHALSPGLPALVPPLTDPRPDLDPLSDTAALEAEYHGRGLEIGMEFKAPMLRNKLVVEASFSVTALRGKSDTSYASTTHFYEDPDGILTPPYTEFEDFTIDNMGNVIADVDDITQESESIGLNTRSIPRSGTVIDTSLLLRYNATSFMSVLFGFRNAYYENLGAEYTPGGVTPLGNQTAFVERDRSANYEGFFGGLGFRF